MLCINVVRNKSMLGGGRLLCGVHTNIIFFAYNAKFSNFAVVCVVKLLSK